VPVPVGKLLGVEGPARIDREAKHRRLHGRTSKARGAISAARSAGRPNRVRN
jgi:hypothetical protein